MGLERPWKLSFAEACASSSGPPARRLGERTRLSGAEWRSGGRGAESFLGRGRLDDGLDPEELITGVRVTIGEHVGAHIGRNLHLLGKPEYYGAAFEMVIRISYTRCHPREWRNGCEEVREHLEDLVIATPDPGHSLVEERDG